MLPSDVSEKRCVTESHGNSGENNAKAAQAVSATRNPGMMRQESRRQANLQPTQDRKNEDLRAMLKKIAENFSEATT